MADTKQIVKHPGGVILHLSDGSAEHFAYGTDVSDVDLADYQRENLGRFTDDKDRTAYVQKDPAGLEHDAHRHAAMADAGQVNSTSDPVPGNYAELNEVEASQLIGNITDARVQARLLLHERLHGGNRQMVIDAGSPLAVAEAEMLFNHIADGGNTNFDQTPVIDRERQIERGARNDEKQGAAKSTSRQKATPEPQS